LDWLGEIEQLVKDDAPPPAPEKYAAYCNSYCKFYDPTGVTGCSGITK
jgi:hypothetical protein